MKAFNAVTLITQHSTNGTVATECITSNALTVSVPDARYVGLRISTRIARAACLSGRIEAGKAFELTAPNALKGALDGATLWVKSGRAIHVEAYVDFGDYYDTTFGVGGRVSGRDFRELSSAQRELYNWMLDHAKGIRRAIRVAKLSQIDWGKLAYGVHQTIAEVTLTRDVGVDRAEPISATARIIAY